jgi:hypothetical protein
MRSQTFADYISEALAKEAISTFFHLLMCLVFVLTG